MGTRRSQGNLSSALFGKTRQAVLALLYSRPDEAFYVREVTRAAGAGQGSVQRELARLLDVGIIARIQRGRQVYYQANRACPIFSELRGLVLKTAGLGDVLRSALLKFTDALDVALVYGSHATGEASATSDVDLLVAGDVDELALHKAIGRAETELSRPINYTLLDRREFRRRRRRKQGFPARALAGETILILGSLDAV